MNLTHGAVADHDALDALHVVVPPVIVLEECTYTAKLLSLPPKRMCEPTSVLVGPASSKRANVTRCDLIASFLRSC